MRSSNTITEEEFKAIEQTRRDITIKLYRAELPESIHGFSHMNRNGSYLIVLDSTDSQERQTATFLHECLHIFHEDHTNEDLTASQIAQIEAIRHKEIIDMLETLKAEG